MKQHIIRITSIAASLGILSLVAFFGFVEASELDAVTDNFTVALTVDEGIAISDCADVTMSSNLSTSVNEATGSTSCTVTTNSDDGYNLAITASTDEALRHSGYNGSTNTYQFQDFNNGASTTSAWDSGKGSNIYTFGFSAYGSNTNTSTYGSGGACGSGTIPTNMNYAGFESSSARTIASNTATTTTSGTTTTICFAAEQVGVFAPSGSYSATVTATALVN